MTLNLSIPEQNDLRPKITVCGVGGAGGNAVNNMIEKSLDGVDFVTANTDAQALQQSRANSKIQLGVKVTEGLGLALEHLLEQLLLRKVLNRLLINLLVLTCALYGRNGRWYRHWSCPNYSPSCSRVRCVNRWCCNEAVPIEGVKRMRQAEEGVEALQKMVDTLIIIPNQNLFRIATEKTTFTEASVWQMMSCIRV